MTTQLVVSDNARTQIDAIDDWWLENREKAPLLFVEEIEEAFERLVEQPHVGARFPRPSEPRLRRLLLRRTGFYVY